MDFSRVFCIVYPSLLHISLSLLISQSFPYLNLPTMLFSVVPLYHFGSTVPLPLRTFSSSKGSFLVPGFYRYSKLIHNK